MAAGCLEVASEAAGPTGGPARAGSPALASGPDVVSAPPVGGPWYGPLLEHSLV